MTTVIEAARDYLARGWQIVPIPVGRKGPIVQGWQCRQWQPEDFEPDSNIGIILGPRSGDLVDVDHDCSEALMLAPIYLPPTGAIFGRSSKPRSHWLYVSPSAVKESFADLLSGEMLVELRAAGRDGAAHQTLVPPSVTNGERRTWEGDKIEPTTINAAKLHQRCVWLAVASLVRGMCRRPQRSGRGTIFRICCTRPIQFSVARHLHGSVYPIPRRRNTAQKRDWC